MPNAAAQPRDVDLHRINDASGRIVPTAFGDVAVIAAERAEQALLDLARALGRRAAREDFARLSGATETEGCSGAVARS